MQEQRTSRRDFLYMTAATATAVCTGCALLGSRRPDVEAVETQGEVRLDKAQSSALLRSESSLLVGLKGTDRKILVVSDRNGQLHAVSAICTHMGCTVVFKEKVGHIVCPCHGSEFALDGANLKGPAKRPLESYRVRNDDGRIVIRV
jgi:cytochrome b6-f complex iron-sulfur subunit